jgi:uncharacterized protein YecE (DUF72 family)
MEYYIGTSGYSYQDWIGNFYPEGTKKGEMLEFYRNHFKTVELNFSYYAIPNRYVLERIAEKSAGMILFSMKLNREITHQQQTPEEVWAKFREGLKPLKNRGLLSVLLAQFPWSFKNNDESWKKLKQISEYFKDESVVVEFRNSEWALEEVRDELKQLSLGFCVVDEPEISGLMPWKNWVTDKIGYIRLHGRNKAKWFNHSEPSERYDYLYSDEELNRMIPDILEIISRTEKSFIFFNNHPLGKAVENAKMLIDKLAEAEEVE